MENQRYLRIYLTKKHKKEIKHSKFTISLNAYESDEFQQKKCKWH